MQWVLLIERGWCCIVYFRLWEVKQPCNLKGVVFGCPFRHTPWDCCVCRVCYRNHLWSGPSVHLHTVPQHGQQVGHCSHHVIARSPSVQWKSWNSCKDCQAHDVQVSARWHWCLWNFAWAQEHPSAGHYHWPQSCTTDVWTTDKNQTSSSHKPTSEQEAVSSGTEVAYPKATDCKAKQQQMCKRHGPTPKRTTCVLPVPGGTEVEKWYSPKQEGWTFLHHWTWRWHRWCVLKKQNAHLTHMHLKCSRTTGPDKWLAAEPRRTWGCWEECGQNTGRQFTSLWRAF